MTILFAIIRLLMRVGKEILVMIKLHKKYFFSIHILFDWADVPSYVLVITFAVIFPYDCPCPPAWQWQIGIIGWFLAWITLLKFANKFPIVSKYVLMFWRIIQTFVKVALIIGIPLILAFAWPFYLALHDPEVSVSLSQILRVYQCNYCNNILAFSIPKCWPSNCQSSEYDCWRL